MLISLETRITRANNYVKFAKDKKLIEDQRENLSEALDYMINVDVFEKFKCPACDGSSLLSIMIIHLNDDHKWRRCETDPGDGPTITEWLDELEKSGYDLTVKFTIEGENDE